MRKYLKRRLFLLLILLVGFTCSNAEAKKISIKNHKINIAYCTDDNYMMPTLVSMTSAIETASKDSFYKFTVLVPEELSKENKQRLETFKKQHKSNASLNVVNMGTAFSDSDFKQWSKAAYFRLLLPEILSNEKKCIYLDGDTIVRKDLYEMYQTDMKDYHIAGIRDYVRKSYITDNLEIPYDEYICSGVLILNLDNLRKDNMVEIFKKYVCEQNETGKYHFVDQDILNKACYGKIRHLPFKYGAFTFRNNKAISKYNKKSFWQWPKKEWEEGVKDATVVHFVGGKPWKVTRKNKYYNEWNEIAKKVRKIYKFKK